MSEKTTRKGVRLMKQRSNVYTTGDFCIKCDADIKPSSTYVETTVIVVRAGKISTMGRTKLCEKCAFETYEHNQDHILKRAFDKHFGTIKTSDLVEVLSKIAKDGEKVP